MQDPHLKLLSLPAEYPRHHEAVGAQSCLRGTCSENGCCKTGIPCLGRAFEAHLVAEMEKWLDRTYIWPLFFIVGLESAFFKGGGTVLFKCQVIQVISRVCLERALKDSREAAVDYHKLEGKGKRTG